MKLPPKNSAKGFTLIELMVTIAIMVILSTIGLIIFSQAEAAGRDDKRIEDIQSIQKALEQYYTINQAYPLVLNSLPVSYFQAGMLPKDPNLTLVGGYNYSYFHCAGEDEYDLCSKVENFSKATRQAEPTDGCQPANDTGLNKVFFCVKSLSN